jgi:hypothetical protein
MQVEGRRAEAVFYVLFERGVLFCPEEGEAGVTKSVPKLLDFGCPVASCEVGD